MAEIRDLDQWIERQRRHVRRDMDNLLLFTGGEGSGKSTLMLQLLSALDPTLTPDRIHFTIPDFIRGSLETPRYAALALDEAPISGRRAMHGPNKELLFHLQTCRFLNTHMAICFPHPDQMDADILKDRVRWNIHVPRRGIFQLRTLKGRNRRAKDPKWLWTIHGQWTFGANKGTLWEAYLQRKNAHVRRIAQEASRSGTVFMDRDRIRSVFKREAARQEEEGPPRPALLS